MESLSSVWELTEVKTPVFLRRRKVNAGVSGSLSQLYITTSTMSGSLSRKQLWPKSYHSQRKDMSLSLLTSGNDILKKKKKSSIFLSKNSDSIFVTSPKDWILTTTAWVAPLQLLVIVINNDSLLKGRNIP